MQKIMRTKLLSVREEVKDCSATRLGQVNDSNQQKIFVKIEKCICLNWKMYLPKLGNVLVRKLKTAAVRPDWDR